MKLGNSKKQPWHSSSNSKIVSMLDRARDMMLAAADWSDTPREWSDLAKGVMEDVIAEAEKLHEPTIAEVKARQREFDKYTKEMKRKAKSEGRKW